METNQNYLESVLQKYAVNNFDTTRAKYKATALMTDWLGTNLLKVEESGGGPQGTSINKKTKDLDLLISIGNKNTKPIDKLYYDLYDFLGKRQPKGLKMRNISVRTKLDGIDCDFTIGMPTGQDGDHTVYSRKLDKTFNSNPGKHVQLVKQSGQQKVLQLLKLWVYLNKLELESVYLVMITLHVLAGTNPTNLEANFKAVLAYLASDNFMRDKFNDINDSRDELSSHNSVNEKLAVQQKALEDLTKDLSKVLY
jgi:hypothetical protein